MSDEATSFIAPGMKSADPVVLPLAAPATAKDKLRAFEDEVFGKDVGRINGDVERGIGSPYAAMTPHQKAHYASLEQLMKAEKTMADATATLADAEAKHEAAIKASAAAAQVMDETA